MYEPEIPKSWGYTNDSLIKTNKKFYAVRKLNRQYFLLLPKRMAWTSILGAKEHLKGMLLI